MATRPTVACGWQHCMTVPRELTAGAGGVVLQQPAREIEHHYASVRVGEGSLEVAGDTCFDVVVDGVDGAFTATVDGELKLAFVPANGELPRALRCDLPMRVALLPAVVAPCAGSPSTRFVTCALLAMSRRSRCL